MDSLSISREDPHRLVAEQGPLRIEVTGGNIIPNPDEVLRQQAQLVGFLQELNNVNSFPFIAKWFLTYNVNFVLKDTSIKDSKIKVTPDVTCNNIYSPQRIIFSRNGVSLQDLISELKNSLPEILNGCAVNVTSTDGSSLPKEYIVIESYVLNIEPVKTNYIILFVIVFLASSVLLPALKEVAKFFGVGFFYFTREG